MGSLFDALLERVRNQSADFLAVKRHEILLIVVLVKLRAEIHGVNARIVIFDDEEVCRPQKHVVFHDDLSLEGRPRDTKLFRRWTNDRPCFQKDDPVLARGVIGMDRDEMTRHLCLENEHDGPPQLCCCLRPPSGHESNAPTTAVKTFGAAW